MNTEKLPKIDKNSFICPNCGAFTEHIWIRSLYGTAFNPIFKDTEELDLPPITISQCIACKKYSIWLNEKMVYPQTNNVPSPSEDMPNDVKKDYLEAKNIVSLSPRGACALLRLALDKLLDYLKIDGSRLYDKINKYCEEYNAPEKLKKAFHSIRILGNESVHIGEINMKDNVKDAELLFKILNLIVEETITKPREIDELYNSLPENKRK